jgi:hypothetical protein
MSRLDFTMMYVFHDALRRDLGRLTRYDGGGRPLGWHLFTTFLHIHHTAEDDLLWPAVPSDDPVLTAMAAEHATLDPLLTAVDTALRTNTDHLPATAQLTEGLTAHLRHEEEVALPLLDAHLDEGSWATFGAAHRERAGEDLPSYLPWLLDEQPRADAVLAALPEEFQTRYLRTWQPAYAALDRWPG